MRIYMRVYIEGVRSCRYMFYILCIFIVGNSVYLGVGVIMGFWVEEFEDRRCREGLGEYF